MDRERTRRALLAAIAGGATAGGVFGPASEVVGRFAPLSGSVWRSTRDELPEEVSSPHGSATLRYDDWGVPRVEADDERAAYFAVGYAQGADRLFQMDLQRRQMRGELSAAVGEATLSSDRFYTRMAFDRAAEVTWDAIEGTEVGRLVEAYCAGVNRARQQLPFPVEFELLGVTPDAWRPTDVMLAEKQIAWGLTGSFRTLRRETLAAEVDREAASELHPNRLDHDEQILGHDGATDEFQPRTNDDTSGAVGEDTSGAIGDSSTAAPADGGEPTGRVAPDADVLEWLESFESPPWAGSNSWAVSGEHTASGLPILANDPHLRLQAPPVWYEQAITVPSYQVRGVTFPGVPPVVIGENDDGAWGFTNAGADVIDFYTYETRADGSEYRHGDEWRSFETEEATIAVADGRDRSVTVRRSVHGPVIDRGPDGDRLRQPVGVAWTGFTATRTTEAVRDLNRSTGLADVQDALRRFDEPTQNCVYVDRGGNVLYRVTGKVPIRRTDGEPVAGRRVFDGSAREGEWAGYTAFGESSFEGFVPYEEMPHVVNPPYVGTANQRIVNDDAYPHYFAEAYAEPFRGRRLWNRLDRLVEQGEVTPSDMRDLQGDVRSSRVRRFQQLLRAERENLSGTAGRVADDLLEWDRVVKRGSHEALLFTEFLAAYREEAVRPVLAERLSGDRDPSRFAPNDWVLAGLSPDSRWFQDDRTAAVRTALERADDAVSDDERYGGRHTTSVTHPFDRSGLNYPEYPTDGSGATLFNVHEGANAGSSWRQVCPMAGESQCILPGGNDGSPFGDHYDDQLRRWADREFKRMDREPRGEIVTRFTGGDE